LLLVGTRTLFGTGIVSLLKEQPQLAIEETADLRTAQQACERSEPDVILVFRDRDGGEDAALLQQLVARYPQRVVRCTLDANQLTIYDKTSIHNATVDDLLSAVLK
jgi:DNA-binding NarL/FixJ family response regulator